MRQFGNFYSGMWLAMFFAIFKALVVLNLSRKHMHIIVIKPYYHIQHDEGCCGPQFGSNL
jgi:hypothetical protein